LTAGGGIRRQAKGNVHEGNYYNQGINAPLNGWPITGSSNLGLADNG